MRCATTPEAIVRMVNAGMADTISAEFDRKQAVIDCLCREIDDLKADIHRLRALDSLKTVSLTDSPTWQTIGAYADVKEENARLKAQVERLTEAGDDMAFHIGNDEESQYKCADAWRAAKGVQS